MAQKVTKSICRWCHSMCRVSVHSENGKLVKIEEDNTDPRVNQIFPPTRGCVRLAGAKEYLYHPDRVKFPLKRAGERGENRWERISWDQAIGEIAEKLQKIKSQYGPESLMFTSGTGRTTQWVWQRFANIFGTPNIAGQGQICYGPMLAPGGAMFGWPLRHRTGFVMEAGEDGKAITKCAMIIGMNPKESVLRLWKSMGDAKKMGVKIIVVDPRFTKAAEMADIWLQIRPGTDTALLLSMLHVVISEELYDREFVEKWCYGFDKVRERVKDWTPDRAAELTGIPAAQIILAARTYAAEKPGVSLHGMGMEHIENNQEAIQARLILSAIVGNIDVKGGDSLVGPGPCVSEPEMQLPELLSPEQRKKQLGVDKYKFLSWPGRELIWEQNLRHWGRVSIVLAYANYPSVIQTMLSGKPYPVKACMTIASNPLITMANTKQVYKALRNMELYVVKDYWMTPCAQIADYVLPTACWLERPDIMTGMETERRVVAGEAALPVNVPGEHEYWTDYDYFKELGRRMGQGEYWKWDTLEEVLDYQLAPLGVNLRELMDKHNGLYWPPDEYKKYEKTGFGTSTGKVELYSVILEKLGYDPLPSYEEPKEGPRSRPDLLKEYPYQLITGGRFMPYFHSEHRQIPSVRARRPHPLVQIHPDTAKKLGIDDGDWVWIETIRGRVRQKCAYFDGLKPEVIHGEHGWWFPELPGEEPWLSGLWESNINVAMGDELERCNPKSGGWPLKTALCKVYKCKTY